MNENIKAGADIHAGDGGYSEGTKEGYEAFVKARNSSKGKPTLYLIRGVAGAGKSTFAQSLLQSRLVQRVYEADDHFIINGEYRFDPTLLEDAHYQCQRNTWLALYEGMSVAVSNTSCAEWEVGVYQNIAKETEANFVSIIVENRNNTKNIHGCPDSKIEQMKRKFDIKL
jgi:tRNA A37 threonylcarbamoyladenosine biosynthesis protein TsaE